MAIGDELDRLLADPSMTRADWEMLEKILGIAMPDLASERREIASKEIRHSYGHTVVNILRKWYEPDYEEIVRATAEKLRISLSDEGSNFSVNSLGECFTPIDLGRKLGIVGAIENKILVVITERAKQEITQKYGVDAWSKVVSDADSKFDTLMNSVKSESTNAGFFASIFSIPLILYCFPPVGQPLSILLINEFGDTNWKKIIPIVIVIATLRRKYNFA